MSEKLPNHAWEVRATGKAQCRNCGIIMLDNDRRDTLRYGKCTATTPASHDAGEAVSEALEGIDIAELESLGWQISLCPVCGMSAAAFKPDQRIATLTAELAAMQEQRDRLAQENLERAEAVIAQAANARSLADALKKLNNAARISGGVAGADKNLMDACENAERALSLTGTGRAVNAVLDVLEQLRVTDARLHEVAALCAATEQQRDSLRDEVERLRAWCKVAIRAYGNECYHAAAGYVQAGLDGEKFPETLADMSASGREGE